MALLNSDRSCQVWDIKSGTKLLALKNATRHGGVQLSDDGKWLSGFGDDEQNHNAIRIWKISTGHEFLVGDGDPIRAWTLASSPFKVALINESNNVPRIWDPASCRIQKLNGQRQFGADRMEFSRYGSTLATVGVGNVIKLWKLNDSTEPLSTTRTFDDGVRACTFLPTPELWLSM